MKREDWVDVKAGTRKNDPWHWYYRMWAIYVMIVQCLVGAALIFGPRRWTEGNSLGLIHHYTPFFPWTMIGIFFMVSGLAMLTPYTRRIGYSIGFVLNTFYSVEAVLFTIFAPAHLDYPIGGPDRPGITPPAINNHPNPITIGVSLYGPLIMAAGVRYLLLSKKVDRDG